jgi:heme/copper-type cytochrome/quinol oxidase subunit 4
MDHSVHTADELAKIAGHMVLTVIPYWETSQEITSKRRRIWVMVGSSVAIAAVALVALNFLHTP